MPKQNTPETYTIKPLRWVNVNQRVRYEAFTLMGNLGVFRTVYPKLETTWNWHFKNEAFGRRFATRKEAQAAAERWYRQQLRKALRRLNP